MSIRRSRGWLSTVALAMVLTGSGSLAGPVSAAEFRFNPGPWTDLAMTANAYFPQIGQAAQALAGPSQLSYSGKLTILLVGSDHRDGGGNGERFDTIMVMAINPSNKNISAVSIPRDTARIQIPSQYGGGTYQGKINGMFKYFKGQTGTRNGALERFKVTIEQLLQINIDYVAYIRFGGFDALVDEVGGVPTNIPYELRDPKYIDKPGWPTGAKFLADNSALLRGGSAARCYGGYPKPVSNWGPVMNCQRALVYVRSRKGSLVGCCVNTDFKRAARQQKFVIEAIKRVVNQGVGEAYAVRTKANSMPTDFYTDMPTSNGDVVQMFNLLSGAILTQSAVFAPTTYATHIRGTSKAQLKLDVVRNLCNSYFD